MATAADITVISDDCWAGRLYAEVGLRCRSPFVGMGFAPHEYLNFLNHMQEPGALDVIAVSSAERNYPIIETRHARLFGMHYATNEEFVERFKRRVPLIRWDRLFIKIDFGKQKYRPEDIKHWNTLKLPCSVALFPDELRFRALDIHNGVPIKEWREDGSYMFLQSCRFFNLVRWLQSGRLYPVSWHSVRYRLLFRHHLLPESLRRWAAGSLKGSRS